MNRSIQCLGRRSPSSDRWRSTSGLSKVNSFLFVSEQLIGRVHQHWTFVCWSSVLPFSDLMSHLPLERTAISWLWGSAACCDLLPCLAECSVKHIIFFLFIFFLLPVCSWWLDCLGSAAWSAEPTNAEVSFPSGWRADWACYVCAAAHDNRVSGSWSLVGFSHGCYLPMVLLYH